MAVNGTASETSAILARMGKLAEALEAELEKLRDQAESDKQDVTAAAQHMAELQTFWKRFDGARKEISSHRDWWSTVVLPELFERVGVNSMNLDSGFRVTISQRLYASIKSDEERGKEAGLDWLRSHGAEDLIIETVNASTLGAYAKAELEEGRDLPDELFNVTVKPFSSVTKTSRKAKKGG